MRESVSQSLPSGVYGAKSGRGVVLRQTGCGMASGER